MGLPKYELSKILKFLAMATFCKAVKLVKHIEDTQINTDIEAFFAWRGVHVVKSLISFSIYMYSLLSFILGLGAEAVI